MRAFHHLAIQVRDLAGMERFYGGLFGLPVLERWPDGKGGERAIWLGLEHGFLALEKLPPQSIAERATSWTDSTPGYYVVALEIELSERAAWEGRIRDAGSIVERRTAYSLFFRDPEGNRLAVSHHPLAYAEP